MQASPVSRLLPPSRRVLATAAILLACSLQHYTGCAIASLTATRENLALSNIEVKRFGCEFYKPSQMHIRHGGLLEVEVPILSCHLPPAHSEGI